jgi:LysR family hydrogen peroxide-inducible transcriptional activator
MVAGGAGVTLLPELALATELRRGGLAVRRLAAPEPHRTLALVWRRSSPLGPALRQVAATLREAAAPAQRKATPLGRRTRGA